MLLQLGINISEAAVGVIDEGKTSAKWPFNASENKIEDARFRFKRRVGLLPFAGNYSNDKRYARSNWLCRCGNRESELHIRDGTCPIYNDIWQNYANLDNDEDLVLFFSACLCGDP